MLLCLAFLVGPMWLTAQDADKRLRRDGEVFIHNASRSRFTSPKNWEVIQPENIAEIAKLNVRKPDKSVEATITWSPLIGNMDEALEIELLELTQKYGKEKVSKKEPMTVANKPVYVLTVDDGTARDVPAQSGKETGIVFLFEAGPDDKNRWKIKVRGTVYKKEQAEALKIVESLLQQFQW